jgi:DNA repair exonuclease SbcCD ATPase subunit
MKTRLGFVSNSSSSSFTCQICGHTVTDDDVDRDCLTCSAGHSFFRQYLLTPSIKDNLDPTKLSDDAVIKEIKRIIRTTQKSFNADILEIDSKKETLRASEVFKELYLKNNVTDRALAELILSALKKQEKEFLLNEDGVPAERCPICSMKEFPYDVLFEYMLETHYENNRENLNAEIRSKFKTIKEFKNRGKK